MTRACSITAYTKQTSMQSTFPPTYLDYAAQYSSLNMPTGRMQIAPLRYLPWYTPYILLVELPFVA